MFGMCIQTFGLKNKNKSKKVQTFVAKVEAQAKDIVFDRKKAAESKAKKAAKESEAARFVYSLWVVLGGCPFCNDFSVLHGN